MISNLYYPSNSLEGDMSQIMLAVNVNLPAKDKLNEKKTKNKKRTPVHSEQVYQHAFLVDYMIRPASECYNAALKMEVHAATTPIVTQYSFS